MNTEPLPIIVAILLLALSFTAGWNLSSGRTRTECDKHHLTMLGGELYNCSLRTTP